MTPFEKKIAVATTAIGIGGLALSGLQYADPPKAEPAAPATIQLNVASVPAQTVSPSKISQLMVGETVGRQIGYVEALIGPATNSFDAGKYSIRSYSVDGCDIDLRVLSDNSIEGLSIKISPVCTFEWRKMMPNLANFTVPEKITIGELFGSDGRMIVNMGGCLSICGNAFEPELELTTGSTHADNWMGFTAFVVLTGPEADHAAGNLAKEIDAAFGEYSSGDLSVACDSRLAGMALKSFANVKITRIEFHGDRENTNCKQNLDPWE